METAIRTAGHGIAAAARWVACFKHLSLLAVVPITAHAHWHLAVQLGIPVWLAWLMPVAVDAYVLASFRAWREQASEAARTGKPKIKTFDLLSALLLDGVAVAGSHAAGQFDLGGEPLWRAGLAALLGVLLVLTMWRVHALDIPVAVAKVAIKRAAKASTDAPAEPVASPVKPQANALATPAIVEVGQVAKGTAQDSVLAVMRPEVDLAMGEIVVATGRARSTVKLAVKQLVLAGRVVSFGDPESPRYALAEVASQPVNEVAQ